MKFLANENIPLRSIKLLREKKLDVKSVSEYKSGINDREVLALANKDERIILTFDKDYGYLLYKEGISFSGGVIYFKFIPKSPNETGKMLMKLISSGVNFKGFFTVATSKSIRQKPLKRI